MHAKPLKRIYAICAAIVLFHTAGLYAASDPSRELFAKVRPSLVVISTPKGGAASGFIASIGEKKYLITNEHVLRDGFPLIAKLLNGSQLKFGQLELAYDRDLVRIEITDPLVSDLVMSLEDPNVGDTIAVFGNSDGGGVATSLGGVIQGVGPDRLEVNAPFVAGNSGSPIVDTNGAVLGVAAYITRTTDPNDWTKENTRFTKPRRFALRITDVKWISMKPRDYLIRADAIADLETFCLDAFDLLQTDKYLHPDNPTLAIYDVSQNSSKYRRNIGLCKVLKELADSYSEMAYHDAIATSAADRYYKASSSQGRMDARMENYMASNLAAPQAKRFLKAYDQIYRSPASFFGGSDWKTEYFKEEARFWLSILKILTTGN
jgi:hypothetical protein